MSRTPRTPDPGRSWRRATVRSMTGRAGGQRYPGYAQVEYDYTRAQFCPTFEWHLMARATTRSLPRRPSHEARVALIGTAGASVRGQRPHAVGDEGDHTY